MGNDQFGPGGRFANAEGAYSYHECNPCCCKPVWSLASPPSAAWRSDECAELRGKMEARFKEKSMRAALSGWHLDRQARALNRTWCAQVNRELLNPAGWAVEAHHWVTREGASPNNPQSNEDHIALIISKAVAIPRDIQLLFGEQPPAEQEMCTQHYGRTTSRIT